MAEPTARPATPEEMQAEIKRQIERLRANGPKLFGDITTQAELAERLGDFLGVLQGVYQGAAARCVLTPREMSLHSAFFPAALAIIETMTNSPLYGTSALRDQLLHNYERIIAGGKPLSAIVYEDPNKGEPHAKP